MIQLSIALSFFFSHAFQLLWQLRILALHTESNPADGQYHSQHSFLIVFGQRSVCKAKQVSRHRGGCGGGRSQCVPRLMTFFSTHHSPMTVKRNARVLTMGM